MWVVGLHVRMAKTVGYFRWMLFIVRIMKKRESTNIICYLWLISYLIRCVMTAIRGIKGLYPCPVCLVPQDKQGDHTETYDLRSTESMQQVFEDARSQTTREAEEGLLKAVSLRPIEV